MSRILEMLRRQARRAEDRLPAYRPAAGASTVVLRTLSGARERRSWYRTRIVPAVVILAAVVVLAVAFGLFLHPTTPGRAASPRAGASAPAPRPNVTTLDSPASGRQVGMLRPLNSPGSGSRGESSRSRDAKTSLTTPTSPAKRPGTSAASPEVEGPPAAHAVLHAGIRPGVAGTVDDATLSDDERFRRARYYQQTGEFEKAVVEYTHVLEHNEMNVEAHNNLGLLYRDKGLADAAIKEFRKALAIDPRNLRAHNNLGLAYLDSGDVDAAAAEFRGLLAADGRNADAMVNLALALRAGRRAEEAREMLLRAIQFDPPNAAAHYNLALLYEDAGEISRALEHYEAYLKYGTADQAQRLTVVREHCQLLRQRLGPGL